MLADQGANQGDRREKNDKDDGDIEYQLFHATAGFEGCINTGSAESTAQPGSAYLEKNKRNDGYAQNNLNNTYSRKPICWLQDSSSLSMQDH
jgi:hypothetical protein